MIDLEELLEKPLVGKYPNGFLRGLEYRSVRSEERDEITDALNVIKSLCKEIVRLRQERNELRREFEHLRAIAATDPIRKAYSEELDKRIALENEIDRLRMERDRLRNEQTDRAVRKGCNWREE